MELKKLPNGVFALYDGNKPVATGTDAATCRDDGIKRMLLTADQIKEYFPSVTTGKGRGKVTAIGFGLPIVEVKSPEVKLESVGPKKPDTPPPVKPVDKKRVTAKEKTITVEIEPKAEMPDGEIKLNIGSTKVPRFVTVNPDTWTNPYPTKSAPIPEDREIMRKQTVKILGQDADGLACEDPQACQFCPIETQRTCARIVQVLKPGSGYESRRRLSAEIATADKTARALRAYKDSLLDGEESAEQEEVTA